MLSRLTAAPMRVSGRVGLSLSFAAFLSGSLVLGSLVWTPAALHAAGSAATVTTVTVPTTSTPFGTPQTLVATVSSNGAPVTVGFVSFREGSVQLGTAALHADGTASLHLQFPPGAFKITAKFLGSVAGQPSVSAATTLVQTGLSSTGLLAGGTVNGQVALTAVVTGNQPSIPAGSVNFVDLTTGQTLGSAPLQPGVVQSGLSPQLVPPNVGGNYADLFYGALRSADFNGDGIPDYAAMTNYNIETGTNELSIFLGLPNGSFFAVPTGLTQYWELLFTADFNNDGKDDIALEPAPNSTVVLISNGDGTFVEQNVIYGYSHMAGDLNGDGFLDLIGGVGGRDEDTGFFAGDGTGNFTEAGGMPGNVNGPVADYNNDGNQDLIADFCVDFNNCVDGNYGPGVQTFLGQDTFNFDVVPTILLSNFYGSEYYSVTADFNGDGNLDIATPDLSGNLDIFLGDGTGNFLPLTSKTIIPVGNLLGFKTMDVNGDGIPDIVAIPESNIGTGGVPVPNPSVLILLGDGTGGFTMYNGVSSVPATYPLLASSGIVSQPASATATASFDLSTASLAGHTIQAVFPGGGVLPQSASTTYTVPAFSSGGSQISYGEGFSGATVNAQGSAAISGSMLQLTHGTTDETASAFYPTPVDVRSFVSDYTFQVTGEADGFTFTLQNQDPHALGGSGGSLGYAGIGSSVAVKFDLFNNQGEGNNSTGLFVSGQMPTVPAENLGLAVNLHSGDVLAAHLVYDGVKLHVKITDTTTSASVQQSYAINIPQAVGGTTAYAGFTAATGALASTQDILSWTYSALPYFPAFSAQGLSLNGGAAVDGTALHLVDAGVANEVRSAYFSTPVDVRQFTTDFTFASANAIADGLTFVFQNQGPTAIGESGGGLGYAGIPQSVAIKFDLYSNQGEGDDSTGLFSNGAYPTVPAIDLTGTGIDLHSTDPIHAHVIYNGANLKVILTDTVTGATVQQNYKVNIPAVIGSTTAYAGFTAATGALSASENIVSWKYVPDI